MAVVLRNILVLSTNNSLVGLRFYSDGEGQTPYQSGFYDLPFDVVPPLKLEYFSGVNHLSKVESAYLKPFGALLLSEYEFTRGEQVKDMSEDKRFVQLALNSIKGRYVAYKRESWFASNASNPLKERLKLILGLLQINERLFRQAPSVKYISSDSSNGNPGDDFRFENGITFRFRLGEFPSCARITLFGREGYLGINNFNGSFSLHGSGAIDLNESKSLLKGFLEGLEGLREEYLTGISSINF
jgi:hypothetical protein